MTTSKDFDFLTGQEKATSDNGNGTGEYPPPLPESEIAQLLTFVPHKQMHPALLKLSGHFASKLGPRQDEIEAIIIPATANWEQPVDLEKVRATIRDVVEMERQKRAERETAAPYDDCGYVETEVDVEAEPSSATDHQKKTAGAAEPTLSREGLDLRLAWPDGVEFTLTSIRESRDGVRGEITVRLDGRRLHWGALSLSSAQAREALRKKLASVASGVRWGGYLEEAAYRLTHAAREGEPLVTLTGRVSSPALALVDRMLYPGEPTLVYADGDTGKSLFALALATGVHAGVTLPWGLKPSSAVNAAYLDWETSQDAMETRLGPLAAGLGITPPPISYKRMVRPLVDEAPALAADFAKRKIGLVIVDSMMFAVASGEGAAYHEPITAFYGALRLFAPAATLVLSHVTGEDARKGGSGRPFGGAFAFNGPRLVWEAKRDKEVTDATAIAFTCTKANNLPRRPEPFGLRFTDQDGITTISTLDLREAAPGVLASASLSYRLRLTLGVGSRTIADLAEELDAKPDTVEKTLKRMEKAGKVVRLSAREAGNPATWGLAQ